MADDKNYHINLDIKFGGLELIDVPSFVSAAKEEWSNRTLCKVNDSVVRLGDLGAISIVNEGTSHKYQGTTG